MVTGTRLPGSDAPGVACRARGFRGYPVAVRRSVVIVVCAPAGAGTIGRAVRAVPIELKKVFKNTEMTTLLARPFRNGAGPPMSRLPR